MQIYYSNGCLALPRRRKKIKYTVNIKRSGLSSCEAAYVDCAVVMIIAMVAVPNPWEVRHVSLPEIVAVEREAR